MQVIHRIVGTVVDAFTQNSMTLKNTNEKSLENWKKTLYISTSVI